MSVTNLRIIRYVCGIEPDRIMGVGLDECCVVWE
jgi:hypothetical protein